MGCQGVEVVVQPIAREDRETGRGQPPMQLVDYCMGWVMQHWDNLGERIDYHPEPEHMHAAGR